MSIPCAGLIDHYSNAPKFSDRKVWANSVDPDQTAALKQSDLGLHCLMFCLRLLDPLLCSEMIIFWDVQFLFIFMVVIYWTHVVIANHVITCSLLISLTDDY